MAQRIAHSTAAVSVTDSGVAINLSGLIGQPGVPSTGLYYVKIRNLGSDDVFYEGPGSNLLVASDGTVTSGSIPEESVEVTAGGAISAQETFTNLSRFRLYTRSGESTTVAWALYRFNQAQLR